LAPWQVTTITSVCETHLSLFTVSEEREPAFPAIGRGGSDLISGLRLRCHLMLRGSVMQFQVDDRSPDDSFAIACTSFIRIIRAIKTCELRYLR
jgi:hypothetical protein